MCIRDRSNVEVVSGETYKLSVKAKAEDNRTIKLSFQLREAPWNEYWSKEISLTTTTQVFEFDNISPNVNSNNIGLVIKYGNNAINFWLDDIVVQNSACTGTDGPENCSNGIDDDGDGIPDCTDPNCGTPGITCLLYTSPSPRDRTRSRMPSSA